MAVGQGGFYTNNLTIATGGSVVPTGLVAVDLQLPNGSAPQTLAYTIGDIGSTTALGALTVTARAGGGQTLATQLSYGLNIVTVVASAADSVKLPPAVAGRTVFIRNNAANATQVFGSGIDTISSVATATGVSQAATSGVWYIAQSTGTASVAGNWVRS